MRRFLAHVLVYRLLDFYLKFRCGRAERQRPSRPCKSRNKPTGSLRNNERHSIMQLLGAKNDTVQWSAFREGPRPIPSGASQWCHFTWVTGAAGVRSSRCPSPTCQHPRITTEPCGLLLWSWTTSRRHISHPGAAGDLSHHIYITIKKLSLQLLASKANEHT